MAKKRNRNTQSEYMKMLQQRFPEMTAVSVPPVLTTVNGFGYTIYGARDHDDETNTYVKTVCVALFFVPLVFTRAFRVSDADNGGWYFLGQVPLSPMAKIWNVIVGVITLLLFVIVWLLL